MSAYVLVDAEELDPARAVEYKTLAAKTISDYGGTYLIRGTVPDVVEGAWPSPDRVLTVIRFADRDTVERWYASPEYQAAIAARRDTIDVRLLVVDGLPEAAATVDGGDVVGTTS